MCKNNYMGTLFLQGILLILVAALKLVGNYGKDDLLIVALYTILIFVTVVFFYKLSNAKRWGYTEMYLFVLFVLVTAGSGLGLMGISNIITDLVLVIVVIMGIMGVYINRKVPVRKVRRYIANKGGKTYHTLSCIMAKRIKNPVYFSTRKGAEREGYKACKICLK